VNALAAPLQLMTTTPPVFDMSNDNDGSPLALRICPQDCTDVIEFLCRYLDNLILCNYLFIKIFIGISEQLWTSLDDTGRHGMVGRPGLEPGTKALKGPCSTN
jgi:hypothetical protein